jgi:hypothetical protein
MNRSSALEREMIVFPRSPRQAKFPPKHDKNCEKPPKPAEICHSDAKEITIKGSGKDFDPNVVKAFIKTFNKGEMEIPNVVVW